jgi:hypothetical protein
MKTVFKFNNNNNKISWTSLNYIMHSQQANCKYYFLWPFLIQRLNKMLFISSANADGKTVVNHNSENMQDELYGSSSPVTIQQNV